MVKMRKSSFLTFCFAFLPGAGEMYLGMMRKGVLIMCIFCGCFSLTSLLRMEFFLFLLPVIWFYSFFDSLNSRRLTPEQLQEIDRHVLDFSNYPNLRKKWSGMGKHTSLWAGVGLILLGAYLLLDQLVRPALEWFFEYVLSVDPWYINYYFSRIPSFLVAVAIIGLGLHLIRGDKKRAIPSEPDYVEYKGEHHE